MLKVNNKDAWRTSLTSFWLFLLLALKIHLFLGFVLLIWTSKCLLGNSLLITAFLFYLTEPRRELRSNVQWDLKQYSFASYVISSTLSIYNHILTGTICTAFFNKWSVNPTKWSNILKQFVGNLLTNCLSVFDHFVILALKGLKRKPDFGLYF